ncbi:hypothetical protein [Halalkalibacter krulwichiae]|uniref:Uncharacterized protein n=1 Tax=Halalkalibacter krulwichiae TaxID=199441 RepID=A0A1X9MAI0_9BACI|nr:hypothetical protein [Halalkalibacter krulwichiae]ARK30459.1 hypothetical protein BkAM31D_11820 [Halalkalibacter krulwichiae]
MKFNNIFISMMFLFLLTACAVTPMQNEVLSSNDKEVHFSYLEELSEAELKQYQQFTYNNNAEHLKGLSPEKIVLIYMHLIVTNNIELIYWLTASSQLQLDIDQFQQDYDQYLHQLNTDMAIRLRYYNDLATKSDLKKKHSAQVEMSVTIESYTYTVLHELKSEEDVWKMDLIPVMEYLKNEK